jgi:uncharacterized protein (DUF58 family)
MPDQDQAKDPRHYFDPRVISQVKGLDVRARRVVEGYMIGLHKSPFRGLSIEFAEHRQYSPGDDLRRLDWKVYAKSDRYVVKQQEQETNLAAQFVLDCSESMSYRGTGPMSKYDYGATLAATMAWMLIGQQDQVGLTLFDKDIRVGIPPKGTGGHYRTLVQTMEAATPGAATMVGAALGKVGAQLKRRGLVVIISDFLDDTAPIVYGLNRLSFDGHDVMLLHLADPCERDFPFAGPSIIQGMENTGRLVCDPSDLRGVYLEARARHIEELRDACRRVQFDLWQCVTDQPLDDVITRILAGRTRVRHY